MGTSWDVVQVDELSEGVLDAVFDGEIAGVRIPGFVPPQACRLGAAAVLANGFDYYETLDPPLGRIGIAQYDHRGNKDEYFRLAVAATEARERVFAGAGDPIPLMTGALTEAWPGKVALASEDAYGNYFAGIARITVGGIRVHCDWAEHDAPGWQVADVDGQLAWNIYYDLSETGGETSVYRRPSSPDIESYAEGAFGFYNAEAIDDAACAVVHPRRGELVVFSSRNAHAVAPATGAGARISASSFIGRLPDRSLVLWS